MNENKIFISFISIARASIASAAMLATLAVLVWLTAAQPATADETQPPTEPSETGLILPDDLALEKNTRYQEVRIGGRLERVTVVRPNGLSETYQNNRADTLWSAHENELGEVPNMRQWIIRSW